MGIDIDVDRKDRTIAFYSYVYISKNEESSIIYIIFSSSGIILFLSNRKLNYAQAQ